jgi:hypothetical protein
MNDLKAKRAEGGRLAISFHLGRESAKFAEANEE